MAVACSIAIAACHSSPTSPSSATLTGVTVTPVAVTGGQPATGTVVLSAAAPSAGATVTLASNNSAVTVPATVTVASGSSSQTFDIETSPEPGATAVTITATYSGTSQTATLTLGRLTLQTLSLSPNSVVSGGHAVGTVTVATAAPDGGLQVSLSSSDGNVRVPPTVTIPAGDTGQVFDVAASPAATSVDATITATLDYSGSSKSAELIVARLALDSVAIGVSTAPAGASIVGTVALSVAAPADTTVNLSSTSTAAVVPPTVTVPAGAANQTFPIATANAASTQAVTITAAYGGTSRSAAFTVVASPAIASLACSSTNPTGGTSVQCTGTVANPAPAGGWQLALSSDDSTIAGPLQTTLTIPAASQNFQFDVVTAPETAATVTVIHIADAVSGAVLYSQAFTISP